MHCAVGFGDGSDVGGHGCGSASYGIVGGGGTGGGRDFVVGGDGNGGGYWGCGVGLSWGGPCGFGSGGCVSVSGNG